MKSNPSMLPDRATPLQRKASPVGQNHGTKISDTALRIGAVGYLNSKPLVEGLDELLPETPIRLDYPSRLAVDLAQGDLDIALIPSIEYFRGNNYQIISDACVAAHGPVLSVKLYSRVPWGQIKTLALDEGSRTSATLARILLAERHGVSPEVQPLPLDHRTEESSADAILLIGDRAILPPRESFSATWDLGEEWCDWTGLPFVFAMWVAKSEAAAGRSSGTERTPGQSVNESTNSDQGGGGASRFIGKAPEHSASNVRGLPRSGERPGHTHPSSTSDQSWERTEDNPTFQQESPTSKNGTSDDSDLDSVEAALGKSRDLGVERLIEIARREAPLLGLSFPTTISYLSENLQYHLGSAEQSGLRLFYELASGLGLAPAGVDLRFRRNMKCLAK